MAKRRSSTFVLALASIAALTQACASTPDSRIKKNQALFDSYPAEVQSNLRQGKVLVGYDEEMARFAMGDPDEKSTETDESGDTLRWGYTKSSPGFSVGLGGGSFGGGSGVGGGVGMGSGSKRNYTAILEFREGKVTNVRHFEQ